MEKVCIKNMGVYHSFEKLKQQLCFFLKKTSSLCDAFTYCGDVHNYRTRGSNRHNLYVPQSNLEYFKRSFMYVGPNVWNDIPDSIRNVNSI